MKKTDQLMIFMLIGIFSSCNSDKLPKTDEAVDKQEVKESIQYSDSDIDNYKKSLKHTYKELIDFKEDAKFKNDGFSKPGEYREWMIKLQAQLKNPIAKILFEEKIVVGDIQTLAMIYTNSGGNETKMTKSLRQDLDKAFYPQSTVKEAQDFQLKTDRKETGKLLGEWEITNSTVSLSYNYKIYENTSQIIGVKDDVIGKPELLDKVGKKYMVRESSWGEYYIIDDKRNLSLFDQDGELKTAGYSAILVR